jgi:hypothetical protein
MRSWGVSGVYVSSQRWKTWLGAAAVLLAAAVAVEPMIAHGVSCGNDFFFHLTSWLDAQHSMLRGVPVPHWANGANLNAGEPRFMFYPPLSWIVGALLGMFLPWSAVPVVFAWLLLAATGLATRKLAREALAEGPATLAGCSVIFLGFALFTAYKRSAYAEMAGGVFMPLLLLYLLRRRAPAAGLVRSAFDGSTAPLALALAGAWLSNGPAGLMASYLMAAVALLSAAVERSWAPLLRAAAAAALGIGLAAFSLIPASVELRSASLAHATTSDEYRFDNGWIFSHHADPAMYSHDLLLRQISWVAAGMLAVAAIGALIARMRGTLPGARRWWIPLAAIPCAVLFLQLPVSRFVWTMAPLLKFLQFPWRWLLVLEAPMAVWFASAVWPGKAIGRIAATGGCALLFFAITMAAGRHWCLDCEPSRTRLLSSYYTGEGLTGMREYAPPGVRDGLVDRSLPRVCFLAGEAPAAGSATVARGWDGNTDRCTGHFVADFSLPENKHVTGFTERSGILILRLRSFPAWRITLNGHPAAAWAERNYGLMAVPVPSGAVDLRADWQTTPDVMVGRSISVAALLALPVVWAFERRHRQPPAA